MYTFKMKVKNVREYAFNENSDRVFVKNRLDSDFKDYIINWFMNEDYVGPFDITYDEKTIDDAYVVYSIGIMDNDLITKFLLMNDKVYGDSVPTKFEIFNYDINSLYATTINIK